MTAASELWTAVKAAYDTDGLITLTNIRDRSATSVNDTVGETAAQAVIDLWPAYAEEDYDSNDALHVEAAILGVIAVLWKRGGSASTVERVKWESVFSPDGVIARVRRTNARSRMAPSSNSGVSQKAETTSTGRNKRPWSDPASLPPNYLPSSRVVDYED